MIQHIHICKQQHGATEESKEYGLISLSTFIRYIYRSNVRMVDIGEVSVHCISKLITIQNKPTNKFIELQSSNGFHRFFIHPFCIYYSLSNLHHFLSYLEMGFPWNHSLELANRWNDTHCYCSFPPTS